MWPRESHFEGVVLQSGVLSTPCPNVMGAQDGVVQGLRTIPQSKRVVVVATVQLLIPSRLKTAFGTCIYEFTVKTCNAFCAVLIESHRD